MSPTAAESNHSSHHHRRWGALLALAAVALVVAVATAFAASAPSSVTLGSSTSSGKQVLVNPQGRTLYVLNPETSRHLLCKSKECLSDWPPLLVKSASSKLKAGTGVKGRLGTLHRSNGTFQVTLNGLPLYRYAGDSSKGQANGEGIKSFGGTWHAVKASGGSGTGTTPSTPVMPAPEPEPAPYKY
jgi:predicted lipoprotein with Yx(FWY)xxD motif